MQKYNTNDYFLDKNKNLCIIQYILRSNPKYTYVCIQNIQKQVSYTYPLVNSINEEPHILKYLGQLPEETVQILYS